MTQRLALFGGVYSNHVALRALLGSLEERGVTAAYCLGDLGAFGPHPDRAIELLRDADLPTVRGNYDDSVGRGLDDCQCGYTDPKDNHYARLSYRYTFANTSPRHRDWLCDLPREIRLNVHGRRVLLCHGSPRKTNEFLWETTTSTAFLRRLFDEHDADVIVTTHTGLHWRRRLEDGRLFINCGALGRPANDGRTCVWYALLTIPPDGAADVAFVPVEYDHAQLAAEMRSESLPEEFVATIETGWWTTCLEVLPGKERSRGRY